jgi:HEAT repeat protein
VNHRERYVLAGAGIVSLLALGLLHEPPRQAPIAPAVASPAPADAPADAPAERTLAVPHFDLSSQGDVHAVLAFMRGATGADVPVLRRLALIDHSPLIAGRALRQLSILGTVAGDAELRELVHDPRLRVRQEAIMAFERSRDPDAVADLERVLAGGDPQLRPLALRALTAIDTERARAVVRGALDRAGATAADRAFATPETTPRR